MKAEYVYDAWGNHSIVRNDDDVGTINPFRYRGYYFDTETGLYCLRTRYYDPETGRFVNADAIGILDETSNGIYGLNLQLYNTASRNSFSRSSCVQGRHGRFIYAVFNTEHYLVYRNIRSNDMIENKK